MNMKKALNILKQMPFWFFISLLIILLAIIGIICIAKFFEKADIIFAFSRETLDLLFKFVLSTYVILRFYPGIQYEYAFQEERMKINLWLVRFLQSRKSFTVLRTSTLYI